MGDRAHFRNLFPGIIELIGLYDKISDVLWTCNFLKAQGYKIKTNIVYQDNTSTLSLAKNGYVSSSKRTKHIKAKYFFVKHFHTNGEIDLQYCPTEMMWADVLTKPLQGAKFHLMQAPNELSSWLFGRSHRGPYFTSYINSNYN